ncbi:MAG: putative DNA-binding domain-containing protein [Gammaproteobacteria bacterium]
MAEEDSFLRAQRAFAAHIRDPEGSPAPADIEDRRMAIYRDLFFNNVSQLLSQSFPVLKRILGADAWAAMIRDWFVRHRARTPLFLELPKEFLDYLENERERAADDPPFLAELAHYEWVELALSIDERDPWAEAADISVPEDLSECRPRLSPLAWPLAYRFPVHRISPEFQPGEPPEEPTFLVVFRDRQDRVGFLEINRVTARLLELLSNANGQRTARDCLAQIAAELGHPQPDAVIRGGRDIVEDLLQRDVLLAGAGD